MIDKKQTAEEWLLDHCEDIGIHSWPKLQTALDALAMARAEGDSEGYDRGMTEAKGLMVNEFEIAYQKGRADEREKCEKEFAERRKKMGWTSIKDCEKDIENARAEERKETTKKIFEEIERALGFDVMEGEGIIAKSRLMKIKARYVK